MEIGKPAIFIVGGLGLLTLLTGFILEWYGNGKIISMMMVKNMALTNGSLALERWRKPPQAVTFSVYFFNVTNPDEVSNGSKPIFSEIGPYVYDQYEEKVDIKEEANDTISYKRRRQIFFNPKLSACRKETDVLTIINFPLVGTVNMIASSMPYALSYLDGVWAELFPGIQNIFITAAVKDHLFDGIDISCTSKAMAASMVCNNLEDKAPETIRKDGRKNYKFSFFHHRNKTADAVFRVYRGQDDLRKLLQMHSYNNRTNYKFWGDSYCGMMNGSDGSQFPLDLNSKEDVYIFQTDVCRSLFAKFEAEAYRDDIKLYKYRNTPELFDSPLENPSNECYCSRPLSPSDMSDDDDDEEEEADQAITESPNEKKEETEDVEYEEPSKICVKKGAMLLTPCVKVPIIATFPHYYMGDSSYMEFTGLKPNKTLHETFSEIEPTTGIPVRGYKRLQFNLEIQKIPSISLMANLPSGIFPGIWVEEGFTLTEQNFAILKHSLSQKSMLSTVTYILIGVGIVFLLIAYALYAKRQRMCCWESSFTEPRRSSKIQGYDNHGFGAKGVYSDKMRNGSLMNHDKNHKNSEIMQFVEPISRQSIQQSYNRMNPAFRRQSNVVSYIENFM